MDDDVRRWALEFIVRKTTGSSDSDALIRKMVRLIPLSKSLYRSKKASLLRSLQHDLSTACIIEGMLEKLELLEELHRTFGSPVFPAMPAAYCAVAVECTLKYLELEEASPSNNRAYVGAVDRIWRGRVRYMEPSATCEGSLLFSEELKRWSSDIEASLRDSKVRERLASLNSRRDAIHKLKVCLAEAWQDLGPSFLELAASTASDNVNLPTHTTEVHGHEMELGKEMNREPSIENQSTEAPIENQCTDAPIESRSTDAPIGNQSADADFRQQHVCESTNNIDGLTKTTTACQSDVHHPSLMERNNTAHTYEWDESADELEGITSNHASKIHLPSPKWEKISPLKKYEPQNIVTRRKRKKWSALEEETLRTAVNQLGEGNWKLILNSHRDIFADRTQVDLKDKWRNLTRYGAK